MSFARNLFTVSGFTIISRLSGFVRDTLTATFLGADYTADAFFAAQRLPNLFRTLFAEGAFSASFVPLYTSEKKNNGQDAAQKFAGQALAALLAVLLPFSALMMICMPLVVRYLLAPEFANHPGQLDTAVNFMLITFPYLLLISITALQGGILNAQSRFGAAAAAPISLNVVLVAAIIIAYVCDYPVGYTLSWAFLLSGFVQLGWLAISCYRADVSVPLMWPKLNRDTMKLFKRIGPGAIGAGAMQINMFLSVRFASSLPEGGVSCLAYADRLNQLPLGIVGIAVATTLLPLLSRHFEDGSEDNARHYISRAIEFSIMLGLPAAIGYLLLAQPIVQTLFEHGVFKHDITIRTAETLMAYAPGIPAFLLVKVFASSFYARHNTSLPVKLSLITMVVNIVGAYFLVGPLQHVGIGLANSIAMWLDAILLYVCMLKLKLPVSDDKLRNRFPRLLLCTAGMGGVVYGMRLAMAGWFVHPNIVREIIALSVIIGVAGIAYALMLQVTGAMRWKEALGTLRRRGSNASLAKSGPGLTE